MRVTICDSKKELGRLAAAEGASYIKAAIEENGEANVVFVTGKSQVDTLLNLAKADIDWSCVNVFHLDEFIGLKKDSISSSRYFLQEFFLSHISAVKSYTPIDSDESRLEKTVGKLNALMASHRLDVAFICIGENGHLAFNDPPADFDTRDRRVIEGLSNLTFARRSDGSFLMVCRGGGVWVSRDGVAPYRQITERRIYPAVAGEFEDPVVWRDSLQYHLIVNDWLGRIAYYQRSLDGVHWLTEPGEAYAPGVSFHRDGRVEHWFKYERAKVLQDAQGRVEQINFAVIDTIKWNDLGGDRHSSKNICLPMNKGLLLEVLNRKPITDKTRTVRLRIRAEKDFHPITDVDVASVRFGCYTEVNYGRGARALSAEADGEDLILTFDAAACAITPEEFAPKLIGADRRGRLLFGYARLPYVDYRPPILSSLAPRYDSASQSVSLTVENFGLSTSAKTRVAIEQGGRTVATATVSRLKPYASTTLTLPLDGTAWDAAAPHRVVFSRNGRTMGETEFPGTPTP